MTRFITLAEYFWLAEKVTGVPAAVLTKGGPGRPRRLSIARTFRWLR